MNTFVWKRIHIKLKNFNDYVKTHKDYIYYYITGIVEKWIQ